MSDIKQKYNLAVFASGSGSNFVNIFKNICNGKINARAELLISNNKCCNAVKFANDNNINCKIINNIRFKDSEIDSVMLGELVKYKIDFIVLAGYMKKIPEKIVNHYKGKILNIHPALLPRFGGKGFYGIKVHEAVIESGVSETGITIHIVDNHYDTGNIIYQKTIKVSEYDTANSIAKKVLALEHESYPVVIEEFLKTI